MYARIIPECLLCSTVRNDELLRDGYKHFERLVTGGF